MKKIKLTISFLKQLSPGEIVRYADSEVPGLQVRTMKQSVSFYLRKRHGGAVHEICLGKFPDMTLEEARRLALDKLGAIANHQDINAGSGRQQPLLREAVEAYIETQRSRAAVRSTLGHFAHLRERKIVDITPDEIRRVFESMKATPYAANSAIKYLSAAINSLARKLKTDLPNPTAGITLNPTAPRTRYMQEHEAPRIIGKLIEFAGYPLYRDQAEALLVMIYTGQRKGRILNMRGDQVDLAAGAWNVPGNDIKRPVRHVLNDPALEIIARRIEATGEGYLFQWRGKPLKDVRKTFSAVCKACGIDGLVVHDLRRSLGSWMLSTGSTIEEVSKTLGHGSIRITEQVYAHLLQSRSRAATNAAVSAMKRGSAEEIKPGH